MTGPEMGRVTTPDFLRSNSDAARITGLSVRFECDDAGAN
jgi:hypothetical protein